MGCFLPIAAGVTFFIAVYVWNLPADGTTVVVWTCAWIVVAWFYWLITREPNKPHQPPSTTTHPAPPRTPAKPKPSPPPAPARPRPRPRQPVPRDRGIRVHWASLLLRDDSKCGICGKSVQGIDPSDIQIDHIRPRSRGGSNNITNLQLAHRSCNARKGDRARGWRHASLPPLLSEEEPIGRHDA